MSSPCKQLLAVIALVALLHLAHAQTAGGSPPDFPAVTPYGMLLAQNNPAIERARLQHDTLAPTEVGVDANGTALPTAASGESSDDSFGKQMIVKDQPRVREFTLNANASFAWTDNVALTRHGERDDIFGIWNVNGNWSHRLTSDLALDVGARVSIFRYNRTPALDFDDFGFGAGLSWAPRNLPGVSFFGRYDFTELRARDGDEILMEHALTVGVQKSLALGRSHGFSFGASAVAELADPSVAQREQIAAFVSYHLQLTRNSEAELLYRPAAHFYTNHAHSDFNQIVSVNFRYHVNRYAELNAFLSYGLNRSDKAVFDYNALTTGAGLSLTIRF